MSAKFQLKTLTTNVLDGYVRHDRTNRRAVLFVHGFGGNMYTTWQPKAGGQYFFDLLKDDPDLAEFDYLTFGFRSGPIGGAAVSNVAAQLKNQIDFHLHNRQIVLVAHSLGGIVCMRYILDELIAGQALKIAGLVMYGTPTNGTGLVKAAQALSIGVAIATAGVSDMVAKFGGWLLGRNAQLTELAAHSEVLQQIHDQWIRRVANGGNSAEPDTNRRAFLNVRMVTGNDDWVVAEHSAKGIYGEIDWHPLTHGHIDLVKPEDRTDARYLVLKSFLQRSLSGLSPNRLSRVKHFAEQIWASRSETAIKDWNFTAHLDLDRDFSDTKLADAGFASSSFTCTYRRVLTSPSIVIGISIGHTARGEAWDRSPQPYYVHQLLVDFLPQTLRGQLAAVVEGVLNDRNVDEQWATLFPEISVTLNGIPATAGELEPNNNGRNIGWLRRTFLLPSEHHDLLGQEVEFSLTYTSAIPKALNSYNVFYPWLIDGCRCTVRVNAKLETFVPVYNLPRGIQYQSQEEPPNDTFRSLTVQSGDLFIPGSNFSVFWSRRNGP